jgi:hypothetical protein
MLYQPFSTSWPFPAKFGIYIMPFNASPVSNFYSLLSAVGNNDMGDARTFEVGVLLVPLNLSPSNYIFLILKDIHLCLKVMFSWTLSSK